MRQAGAANDSKDVLAAIERLVKKHHLLSHEEGQTAARLITGDANYEAPPPPPKPAPEPSAPAPETGAPAESASEPKAAGDAPAESPRDETPPAS